MMEVITMYEDLISRLRNTLTLPPFACATMNEAADAIEDLTQQLDQSNEVIQADTDYIFELSKPHWIPVTERLPEPDKTDSNGFAVQYLVMNGWRKAVARRTDKYWVLFGTSIVLKYVTHWMPLPEPPKEE